MEKPYSVIEIGTRGIRIIIGKLLPDGSLSVLKSTGELSNLGEEADDKGYLSTSSIERVNLIIKDYVELSDRFEAKEIFAVATEVVRQAPNKGDFVKIISKSVTLQVLSQNDEAFYSYLASTEAFKDQLPIGSTILVVDQGGGSTELTAGYRDNSGDFVLAEIARCNLGTVELTEMLIKEKNLRIGFENILNKVKSEITNNSLSIFQEKTPNIVVGLGSAITTLAARVYEREKRYKPRTFELHKERINFSEIDALMKEISNTLDGHSKDDFGKLMNKGSENATLISGIPTYYEIMNTYKSRAIYLSRHGMRYGVLLHIAGKQIKKQPGNGY